MRVSIRVLLALVALLLCAATVQGALGSRHASSRRDLRAEQAPEELIKLTKRGVFRPLPPRPTPQKQALKDLPNGYSPLMAFSQPPTNAPKGLFEAQWDVIEYHSSGGYDTEMEGVINNARLYASMMPAPTNRSAWVFDIDETTLSGYEFMKSIGFGYIAKINHEWVQTSSAPAIPQALGFYQQLLKQGFKIIFLTGRKDDEHDATELNLHKQGYTTYEMLITRTPAEYNLTASVFKNARRTQFVEELGYDIVGCVGDQFSDMAGPYTGFKVKLPNAIYFLP